MNEDKPSVMPPVPPFVRFVASAVPMVFDDSLSYYEALCALWKYVSDMTDVINNNATLEEEYILKFNELKSYVENYFANLDVQEEINNKLDVMAEDGTLQTLINNVLQPNVTWTFDTVADMKLSENLVSGGYARTLGFHSVNDGGSAIYYIDETGTANEMDIIAIGDLRAHLVCNEANVKQFGAYGDNTHSDDTYFAQAVSYAQTNNLILRVPVGTYKLDNAISMKHLKIRCDGELNNANTITLGAYATGSTYTDVHIFKCKNVQIEGAKVSKFDIEHCGNLTLYADGSDTDIASIAYNKFNMIEADKITLNGVNSGWINENEFNVKRALTGIQITGDGSYGHNNNRFNNVCIEGSTKVIQIDYGHNNYISYRGEQRPQVIIGSDSTYTYNNTILYQYNSTAFNMFDEDYTQESTAIIQPEYVPTYKSERLLTLNKYNAKNLDSTVYINGDGRILSAWSDLFVSPKFSADKPFTIIGKCNESAIRLEFKCYDASDNQVQGNCGGAGITYSNNAYNMSANGKWFRFTFYPDSTVKNVQFRVYSGNNVVYDEVTLDLVQPFMNDLYIPNTKDTLHRYANSSPDTDSNTNHYWTVGDVVWCKNSSLGIAGWYCQYSGNPGTWKTITIGS